MAINKPLSHSCMRESGCCFSRMESIHRMGCRFHQGYSLIDSDFSVVFEVRIDMDGRIIRVKFQLRDMQMSAGKILCAEPEAKAIGTVLALIGEITATAAGAGFGARCRTTVMAGVWVGKVRGQPLTHFIVP